MFVFAVWEHCIARYQCTGGCSVCYHGTLPADSSISSSLNPAGFQCCTIRLTKISLESNRPHLIWIELVYTRNWSVLFPSLVFTDLFFFCSITTTVSDVSLAQVFYSLESWPRATVKAYKPREDRALLVTSPPPGLRWQPWNCTSIILLKSIFLGEVSICSAWTSVVELSFQEQVLFLHCKIFAIWIFPHFRIVTLSRRVGEQW